MLRRRRAPDDPLARVDPRATSPRLAAAVAEALEARRRYHELLEGLRPGPLRDRRPPFTYDRVAATVHPDELPEGYHHVRAARVVGNGDEAFAAAVEGIRRWQLHRRQGYRVAPDDPPVEVGTVVAVDVPLIAIHVVATCRIAWVVDEPGRFGFGYGTLPVHPESGEEAFVVERDAPHDPGGAVRLAITAFSRPRHPLVRVAGPVARRQQARATQGYLDALAAHVREVLAGW